MKNNGLYGCYYGFIGLSFYILLGFRHKFVGYIPKKVGHPGSR